jgi:hypothetical protein
MGRNPRGEVDELRLLTVELEETKGILDRLEQKIGGPHVDGASWPMTLERLRAHWASASERHNERDLERARQDVETLKSGIVALAAEVTRGTGDQGADC